MCAVSCCDLGVIFDLLSARMFSSFILFGTFPITKL